MGKLHLTLPLPISVNQLYTMQYAYNKKYRKYMPTGRKILSDKGNKKKAEIVKSAKDQMRNQAWLSDVSKEHYVYQDIDVYFNRKRRDADNILKLLNDSLNGIVYHDDSKVLTRINRIYIDRDNPRVECTYSVAEWIGIFDDKNDYEHFIDKCVSCKFYRDNRCSILTDSVEGVIREEVEDKVCKKYTMKKDQK